MTTNYQYNNKKTLLILSVLFLTLQGCSTTVPLIMKFPEAPPSLMRQPPPLIPLSQSDKDLSDMLVNANENYGRYYELREKYLAWQEWYREQKEIYEEVK